MTLVVDEASPTATKFSRFQGLFGDGIQVSTGATSSGTMTTTVKNTDFQDAFQGATQTGSGGNGLRIAGVGGGKHTVDIQNNTFLNVMKPVFAQGVISMFINDNSQLKGTIAGNTITNATQNGITIFADNVAGQTITDMDLIIQNNTMDNISGSGIQVAMTVAGGTLTAADIRILDNNIGQNSPVGDGETQFGFGGGPGAAHEGVLVTARGTSKTVNVKIDNNKVKSAGNQEALQISGSENATINATVTNNTLTSVDTINGAPFFGQTFGTGSTVMCLDLNNNSGNNTSSPPSAFYLSKSGSTTFNIENVATVTTRNTGTFSPTNPSASGYGNSAGCPEPPVGIT
jgi:hypothetical protein